LKGRTSRAVGGSKEGSGGSKEGNAGWLLKIFGAVGGGRVEEGRKKKMKSMFLKHFMTSDKHWRLKI